ncbi:aspartate/glutamate racemase family protein [Ideonella sp. YS5]
MNVHLPRKIGLIGGLSYPSTLTYYARLNQRVNQRLGRAHSARIVLESLDFQPIAQQLATREDLAVIGTLQAAARRLVEAGAEVVALCCNTVHKFAPAIEAGLRVPLINICQCTAQHCAEHGYGKVALMGSAFTMEEPFYRDRFARFGVNAVVPSAADRLFMQRAIESELSVGNVPVTTRDRFVAIAQELCGHGAEALVLACTEIPLVLRAGDVDVPVIDTVELHCAAIVQAAFAQPLPPERNVPCAVPS